MSFQTQVEGLTQLTIATDPAPSAAELGQFLIDGVLNVTSKWLLGHPEDRELFSRATSTLTSNGVDLNSAQIISVIREASADGDTDGSTAWEPCRRVSAALRSRVVDPDSLHFASIYNPVYIVNNNGAINVYPVPDAGAGVLSDGYRVYYVNNDPKGDGISDTLAAGHSSIGYFPNDKEYLVVLYAAVKTLEAAAGNKTVAQDVELQTSYSNLANALKGEYMAAFQTQQPQQGAQPRR